MSVAMLACGGEQAGSAPHGDERIEALALEEIGVVSTLSAAEGADPRSLLQKPLDAAFVGEHVAILDASAPWIRVFDRRGRLVRAIAGEGEGPAEALRPYTLSGAANGDLLLTHSLGVTRFDEQGAVVHAMRGGLRARGAVEACGGQHAVLLVDSELPRSAAVVRLRLNGGELRDTIAVLSPVRSSGRNYHPWFVEATADRLLFYSEEERAGRLLEIACDGRGMSELPVDSLGRGELIEGLDSGDGSRRISVRGPLPPFPAGLATVRGRILWAARVVEGTDSLTVITALEDGGGRRLRIKGWYQLLDADETGALLISNTWTLGQNWAYGASWGLVPAVHIVDGDALLSALDEMTPRSAP
jgi:hypothetical protein